jgi:hypothetical protein
VEVAWSSDSLGADFLTRYEGDLDKCACESGRFKFRSDHRRPLVLP